MKIGEVIFETCGDKYVMGHIDMQFEREHDNCFISEIKTTDKVMISTVGTTWEYNDLRHLFGRAYLETLDSRIREQFANRIDKPFKSLSIVNVQFKENTYGDDSFKVYFLVYFYNKEVITKKPRRPKIPGKATARFNNGKWRRS